MWNFLKKKKKKEKKAPTGENVLETMDGHSTWPVKDDWKSQ